MTQPPAHNPKMAFEGSLPLGRLASQVASYIMHTHVIATVTVIHAWQVP